MFTKVMLYTSATQQKFYRHSVAGTKKNHSLKEWFQYEDESGFKILFSLWLFASGLILPTDPGQHPVFV